MEGTCDKWRCTECGAEEVEKDKSKQWHKWERVKGTCLRKCTVCGKTEPSYELHEWVSMPGCRKKCKTCGAIAYDHNWVHTYSPVGDSWLADTYTCKKCGEIAFVGGQGGGELPEGLVKQLLSETAWAAQCRLIDAGYEFEASAGAIGSRANVISILKDVAGRIQKANWRMNQIQL